MSIGRVKSEDVPLGAHVVCRYAYYKWIELKRKEN